MTELESLVESMGISLEILGGPHHRTDDNGWEHNAYTVKVWYEDEELERHVLVTPWQAGTGIEGVDVADVVHSLASDYGYYGLSFEEFCEELGYDTDSRRAERQWRAVQEQSERFENWIPDEELRQKLVEAEH